MHLDFNVNAHQHMQDETVEICRERQLISAVTLFINADMHVCIPKVKQNLNLD